MKILLLWPVLILRSIAYPLWPILGLVIPFIAKRLAFEKGHGKIPKFCDFTVEVSSEGEWQQVWPLLQELLDQGKTIALYYCSPSVEMVACKNASLYQNLYTAPLPLLRFSLFPWPGSKRGPLGHNCQHMIMVRYDFFPELLIALCQVPGERVLVSASLKGKDLKAPLTRWYWRFITNSFTFILTATPSETIRFRQLSDSVLIKDGDFRHQLIQERVAQAESFLAEKGFLEAFQSVRNANYDWVGVLGSIWPIDLTLFQNESLLQDIVLGRGFLWIFPHQLAEEDIHTLKVAIEEHWQVPVTEMSDADDWAKICEQDFHGVILVTARGVLCEAYSFGDWAYVGGGFGRSVHSLLEPFWSDCFILCGPKVHRSTEYDYIYDRHPERLKVLAELAPIDNNVWSRPQGPELIRQGEEEGIRQLKGKLC